MRDEYLKAIKPTVEAEEARGIANHTMQQLSEAKAKVEKKLMCHQSYQDQKKLERLHDALYRCIDDIRRSQLD